MEVGVSTAAEQLLAACQERKSSVSSLLDALEKDVYDAADRCWRLQDRTVQLRGGLLRAKNVVLQEASFMPDVEQQELGGALEQWRDAVKSVAAAAQLGVGVAEQHLVAAVGRVLQQQEPAASAEQLLSVLSTLLSTHDALLSMGQRDLRPTQGLLGQLSAAVAVAWRQAGGESRTDMLAGHTAAPQEVVAILTAPAAGATVPAAAAPAAESSDSPRPAGLQPEQAAALSALRERQREQLEELADAADALRFWGRRGEKAAAGIPAEGREGDVPPMLTQAQQLLWAACQTYDEEQGAADVRTRALVCQRYRPADAAALQQRADELAGGERVPAQQDLMYEPHFVELRGQARTLAARFAQDSAFAQASRHLHQLRHLLLEAELPAESATARQQLLVRVAEALLDGSTPPAATPLLVGWLQEGLRRAEAGGGQGGDAAPLAAQLSEHDRARLVPMVCRGLAVPRGSGRAVLRREEGAALLRSLLRPEALLDEGRLDEFAATLRLVADTCTSASVPAESAEALLAVFDASRLAVLACERAAAPGGGDLPPGAPSSVPQLLSLAHSALRQPGAEAAGLGIVEGVLALQPAAYLAAALQLALAAGRGQAQQRLLSMLCRVPIELLPPAVVADALTQLAEALDDGTLAPPFLPHDLMGRLLRAPCVLGSTRLLAERGLEAAAAEAAAAAAPSSSQELWTIRVGASQAGLDGPTQPGEEHIASGSGEPAEGGGQQAGAAAQAQSRGAGQAGGSQSVVLLPVQASAEPLAALLLRLVGSVLSCLLRRAGGALDAATLSEELSALLEALLLPAAEEGAWMLGWLWQSLYQGCLRDFLRDLAPVDPASAQLAVAAFQTYWASLPWEKASFHAASPAVLATLRLHLTAAAGDGAAATLLGRLDFTPVLAKAAPPPKPSPREQVQVYSLGDEEEEEGGGAVDSSPNGAAAWAAELGLLALHACVLLAPRDLPLWLQQLLQGVPAQGQQPVQGQGDGSEDEASVHALMRSALSATLAQLADVAGGQQALLPALLLGADWQRLAAAMHAEEATAGGRVPWLLLPALLAGDAVGGGDLGSRIVHAATLLCRGAALARSPQAVQLAATAAGSLLLLSLCQGTKHAQRRQAAPHGQTTSAAEDAALAAALAESAQLAEQQQRVVLPEGFPAELLEGTVEGQQLLVLQQQEQERRQEEAQRAAQRGGSQSEPTAAAPTAAAALGDAAVAEPQQAEAPQGGQSEEQQIVEVQGCWNLTVAQHAALLQQALLPLASSCASNEAAASWQLADLPAELAAALSAASSSPLEWRGPHLADLLQATSAASSETPAAARTGVTAEAVSAGAANAAAIAAALMPLVRPSSTVLLQDSLPFANSSLPLDTEGAVYVSVAPDAGGGGSAADVADSQVVHVHLLQVAQSACKQPGSDALAACLLRLVYACPALHASAPAMQLSEGLLRFLAAPDQDEGPLGRGAPAAAGSDGEHGGAAGGATGVLPAVTAMQGLPAGSLLGLALGAARQQAPLTAALAVERLRQSGTVLPKEEWQAQATQVLQVALQAEAGPAHPYDVVAVWLAALAWVADPRWRRLGSGPHQAALLGWLEALELRVVALQLAQPEDFAVEGSGSAARRLLSGAADRFKAMRQHMPRLGPGQQQPQAGEAGAAVPAGVHTDQPGGSAAGGSPPRGGKDSQLGQRIGAGFRSLLSKAGGKPPGTLAAATGSAAAPGEAEAEVAAAAGERRKWGDKVRHRLARMGLGGKGEQAQQEQARFGAGEEPAAAGVRGSGAPTAGQPYSATGLGTVAEDREAGSFTFNRATAAPSVPTGHPDTGHLDGAAGAGPDGPGGTGAVRQKLSSGLHAVGRGLSRVRERLVESHHQGPSPDELAEHDRDVACCVGLAAFAASAYIKSVLCPSLTPRLGATDSAGPATPTSARPPPDGAPGVPPPSAAQRHRHRTRSSFGSMQLDAEYMRELDRLIEARTELDALDTLAACPLLSAHPERYQAFMAEAPQLLSAGTGVEAFQRRLQQLLFPGERQLAAVV